MLSHSSFWYLRSRLRESIKILNYLVPSSLLHILNFIYLDIQFFMTYLRDGKDNWVLQKRGIWKVVFFPSFPFKSVST